jgi:DNA recombination protein RmuC
MPQGIQIAIAFLLGGALGWLIGWLLARSRGGPATDLSGPLNELERNLSADFQKANVDMAARVEKVKGDLLQDLSGQIQQGLTALRETVERQLTEGRNEQALRLADTVKLLEQKFEALKSATETKLDALGQQQGGALKDSRTELVATLSKMAEQTDKKLEELKVAVERKLTQIQADNSAKLEEMRKTVDEKLQGTLEKRLGESFKLVSDRLEQVHKGLGEMQSLAVGVGDLKKVLTNVKTRGSWGEIQLGNLLDQILTPDQYERNVATRAGSVDRVEFALKLPGRDDGKSVWLPIDAKFPKEDYERLVEAADRADVEAVEQASRQLEIRIKAEAADIHKKYIDIPNTTDFGILYLPTEGLYAEVLRRSGVADSVQRDFRVVIAGPTTLAALLNSLQMGFRTLAIEKRSSEVWTVLGAVKTEFGKFGGVIEKVQKKLQEASNVIDDAVARKKVMERKLRTVTELPAAETTAILGEAPVQAELPEESET